MSSKSPDTDAPSSGHHIGADPARTSPQTAPESRSVVFECSECGNTVLAVGREAPSVSCHGESMQQVSDTDVEIEPPDLRQVLLDVLGLPKAGVDICLCVTGDGPLSATEVAESLGYDRSTATRYLNTLVETGLLRKSQLNREGGGVVNVYHSIDFERMRRETLLSFCLWAGEAAALIQELNERNRAYFEANSDQELPPVFWSGSSGE
jgi:predicted transcriptional regulator